MSLLVSFQSVILDVGPAVFWGYPWCEAPRRGISRGCLLALPSPEPFPLPRKVLEVVLFPWVMHDSPFPCASGFGQYFTAFWDPWLSASSTQLPGGTSRTVRHTGSPLRGLSFDPPRPLILPRDRPHGCACFSLFGRHAPHSLLEVEGECLQAGLLKMSPG